MPTYEYACTACDERLEVVQKFTDASLTECPVCGGKLRKVFSPVGVVFKGSGFYKTDSRGSAKQAASKSGEAAKSESKSESTTAAKSDSAASAGTSSSQPAAASTASSSSTPSAAAAS